MIKIAYTECGVYSYYYLDTRTSHGRFLEACADAEVSRTGIVEGSSFSDEIFKIISKDGVPIARERQHKWPTGYEIERRPLDDKEESLPPGYLWDAVGLKTYFQFD